MVSAMEMTDEKEICIHEDYEEENISLLSGLNLDELSRVDYPVSSTPKLQSNVKELSTENRVIILDDSKCNTGYKYSVNRTILGTVIFFKL